MPANWSSPEKSWATFTSAAVWTSRRKAPSSATSSLPASALRTAPTSRAASKSTQPNPKPPPTKPVTKSGFFAQLAEPRRASKAEKPLGPVSVKQDLDKLCYDYVRNCSLTMDPANRKTWFRRIAFAAFFTGIGAILSLLVFYAWLRTYPDDVDPKNIYYVLWKHGLNNNMNLDSALAAMSHDV